MAEAVILGFAQNITGSLVPILVNELGQLWGIKDELERLKNTASLIKYMLPDAEEKYDEVPEVKAWLLRLKDVFIDTEDLLDEISTAALGNECTSFVHNTAEIRTRILHVSYESIADLPRLRSEMGMKLRTMLCLAPRCPHVPKEPVTLPKDLWRHRCLRVLDLHNANIKTVGSTLRGHACLNELRKLDSLSGKFEIENLGWTKEAVLGTKGANLSKKGRLQKLNLRWYKGWSNRFTERFANHEAILEGLQPNQNLRCLLVEHYEGMRFPRWMVEGMMLSIPNLVEIRLRYCPNIRHLPPLDQLPHLKTLELSKLDTVESIGYSSSGRGVRELDDPAWTGSGRIQHGQAVEGSSYHFHAFPSYLSIVAQSSSLCQHFRNWSNFSFQISMKEYCA
ncbi:hypothetical protein SAY87_012519 [Trapa incisa]|uniref:Rx N-terminal domain-containing protein n=1 Tax=Trapa incisa TaxID=236973 RepID=A0AAN7GTI5_9MYRT|nr:hypothetical protein SAY87_012519 [Trapa incisa]